MNRTKRTSLFWRIYGIITNTLLVGIISFFLLFYDYMGAYEAAQPDVCAKEYAAALTDEAWTELFKSTLQDNLVFESEDKIAEAYVRSLMNLNGELTAKQDYSAIEVDTLHFHLLKGDIHVATLALKSADEGKYGFSTWSVDEIQVIPENVMAKPAPMQIVVPSGSEVTVNGIPLDDTYITENNAKYPFASEFEANAITDCTAYMLELYSTPSVECVLEDVSCTPETIDGGIGFHYPDGREEIYTINALSEASVYINGILVGKEYITSDGKKYTASVWENPDSELPTECTYTVPGLLSVPEVTAMMESHSLEVHAEGNNCHVSYPESLYYSVTLTAPVGCDVFVNGHPLSGTEISSIIPVHKIPAYKDLFGDRNDALQLQVYTLEHLFAPVSDVKYVFNGSELIPQKYAEDREVHYSADYPSVSMPEVEERALAFCKDYFHYTSSGYNNTDSNLTKVLSYMIENSAIYNRIRKSKIGIDYVTPVTSHEYHALCVEKIIPADDNTVICCVYYDIEQWTYKTQRIYDGHLWLLMDRSGDSWIVSGILTDTK